MRGFYLRKKNVMYTSNLSAKLMSQQKYQMDQNDLLRKRAQDLTQENLTLNARVAKLEFLEKTAIKAEQVTEILKRIFHHIPFHEHGPIVSKGVHLIIQGDINDVMQGGNPPSPPPHNASPLSTSTTTSSGSSTFPHLPVQPTETPRDALNLRRSTRIREQSQPRF